MGKLDLLLKQPVFRFFLTGQAILLCTAPGFYLFWLAKPIAFQTMAFSRLALLVISISALVYLSMVMLHFLISLIEWHLDYRQHSDDVTIDFGTMVKKAAFQANMAISLCIIFVAIEFIFFKKEVRYEQILDTCATLAGATVIAWTGDLFVRLFHNLSNPLKSLFTKAGLKNRSVNKHI